MLEKGVHGNLQCGQIPGSLLHKRLLRAFKVALSWRDIKGGALG
jgi:hypothetical protein